MHPRGAVLSKIPHQALVVSFKAQRHYGVSAFEEYNAILDKDQERVPDASDGKDKVLKVSLTPFLPFLKTLNTIPSPFSLSLANVSR